MAMIEGVVCTQKTGKNFTTEALRARRRVTEETAVQQNQEMQYSVAQGGRFSLCPLCLRGESVLRGERG